MSPASRTFVRRVSRKSSPAPHTRPINKPGIRPYLLQTRDRAKSHSPIKIKILLSEGAPVIRGNSARIRLRRQGQDIDNDILQPMSVVVKAFRPREPVPMRRKDRFKIAKLLLLYIIFRNCQANHGFFQRKSPNFRKKNLLIY